MNQDKLLDLSILAWIKRNGIKNERGEELDFSDRPFLLDVLADWNPNICIKKCAQVGGSVTFNLKVLFAIQKLGLTTIYTFPTDSDVQEFVASKTNKLIQQNPQLFKGMATDNIERKELDGRFLFFKGTVSKTAAIATTADLLVHDEVSRSDQKTLEVYKSRTKASKYKGRWLFSNPTTERDQLDEAWIKSDQKEWMVTCSRCRLEQTLVWPDNIDMQRKVRICSACKTDMTRKELVSGRWVAQKPGSSSSGYHISLLMAPWVTAEEIITDSQGDQEYFYNFILGEPYNPGDIQVSRSVLIDQWTAKSLVTDLEFLGVDVGNIKHAIEGSEKGITRIWKFTEWQDLEHWMERHPKAFMVIDAMPDNTMSRYFVKKFPGRVLMSFFQENSANPQLILWQGEGDRQGIVYSHRDRILDQMVDDKINARYEIAAPTDALAREYIAHWMTMRRVKVVNNKGIERYIWDSTTGVDHFALAELYYRIAVQLRGSGSATLLKPAEKVQVITSGMHDEYNNLGEYLQHYQ